MRLVALQSIVCDEAANLLGCFAPAMDSLFPAELRGLTSSPAPVLFRVRVHPLVRFTSSSESLLIHTRPRLSRTSSTFLGVSFPIATSVSRVHTRRAPTLTFVPPSAFRTLSTVYSSEHLAGLFHPTATSGIHSSGAFPATKPTRLVVVPSPPDDCRPSPPAELPRLSSSDRLAFRGLIQAAIRCVVQSV